ncbi:hypothetical protein FOA43_000340 [Brettanomyces nanus]|uniref:RING-type domain-containing protein n=1 Tax=Eeniella nana TaxID=13502 RepID=A0A875RW72_EENNA|nr:uncharacterized protein FOA43_000340 [Brettanomyces nanus]QPG73036.1 hypothetical protein FOA43_000340 [Brettanomyces nanus]
MGQSLSHSSPLSSSSPPIFHPYTSSSLNDTGTSDVPSVSTRSRRLSSFSLKFSRKHKRNHHFFNPLRRSSHRNSLQEQLSRSELPHIASRVDYIPLQDSDSDSRSPNRSSQASSTSSARRNTVPLNQGLYPPPAGSQTPISLPDLGDSRRHQLAGQTLRQLQESTATTSTISASDNSNIIPNDDTPPSNEYYEHLRRAILDPDPGFDGLRHSRRRHIVNEQYENVVRDMDIGMVVQFQTLSTLLESVTISTLRRLLQNDPSAANSETETLSQDEIMSRYNGTRIDRTNLTDEEDDANVEDTTFAEFLVGLNSEHLLQRELGSQAGQGQNLSFFRAFQFSSSSVPRNETAVVPAMIVGLISVNSQNWRHSNDVNADEDNDTISADSIISHVTNPFEAAGIPLSGSAAPPSRSSSNYSETASTPTQPEEHSLPPNTYRSWIIIVMAHHYNANDSMLGAMPLFISLLTNYVRGHNTEDDTDNIFDTTSVGGGANGLDEFRSSLFRVMTKNCHLTVHELAKHTRSMCIFKQASKFDCSWKEKTDEMRDEEQYAYYDVGERCPICMIGYQEGDPGRKLKCKHAFHRECVDEWLINDNTCPICRAKAL